MKDKRLPHLMKDERLTDERLAAHERRMDALEELVNVLAARLCEVESLVRSEELWQEAEARQRQLEQLARADDPRPEFVQRVDALIDGAGSKDED